MKKIALFGHTGFIGSGVYDVLRAQYEVTGFNSTSFLSRTFDIVINCSGVSSKYHTEKNPLLSYRKELDILVRLQLLSCDKVIHISSVDADRDGEYGKLKLWVEERIKKLFPRWNILRVSGVIGQGLKKNIVFDLMENKPIYLTRDSVLNFISINEIANLVSILVKRGTENLTTNVASSKSIGVQEIADLLMASPSKWGGEFQDYSNIDISGFASFLEPRTSREYIEEYLG